MEYMEATLLIGEIMGLVVLQLLQVLPHLAVHLLHQLLLLPQEDITGTIHPTA
uniref:Uncharacterized protein n=1 Tax=Timema genevievae TaxID=629358 RepID=A0A7R9K9T0_TIMGE|nr:unnamed protein product [Timema genevievae]